MRLRFFALSLFVPCALAACSPSAGPLRASSSPNVAPGVAVVTGGIAPCRGISYPTDPKYAAGTVTVLRGQVTWTDVGSGASAVIFPTDVAAHASVGVNGTYRFVLVPGHYVLVATLPAPANPQPMTGLPPPNAQPFTEVTVHGGSTVQAGIPNMCL